MSLSATDRQRLRLFSRIDRRVPIQIAHMEILGQAWPWLEVRDPDQLLTRAVQACGPRESFEWDPFWACTWRASIGLGQAAGGLLASDLPVLELGCGSGRAGIEAAMLGAQVTLTDAVSLALLAARWNGWPLQDRLRTVRLDWAAPPPQHHPRWPLILGSDVVYDPALWPLLEPCLRRYLAPGGRVLLSEPCRQTGDRFLVWFRRAGWRIDAGKIDLGDSKNPIRIIEAHIG